MSESALKKYSFESLSFFTITILPSLDQSIEARDFLVWAGFAVTKADETSEMPWLKRKVLSKVIFFVNQKWLSKSAKIDESLPANW